MKKGISFMLTVVLCAALLTACGDSSGQSGDTNAQSQPENSSAEQGSQTEDQDNDFTGNSQIKRNYLVR